jgi:DNA polymerase III alpha subunit
MTPLQFFIHPLAKLEDLAKLETGRKRLYYWSKKNMLNEYGDTVLSEDELMELLYSNPTVNLANLNIDSNNVGMFNSAVKELYLDYPLLSRYTKPTVSIKEFDKSKQANWHMPQEYKDLDIAEYVLSLCTDNQAVLQRVGYELIEYQKLDFFEALQFLKYMVDVMRKNDIVWGVGRGSSTSSYVLFLLGVHKIDSIYYDLDFKDFIKQ